MRSQIGKLKTIRTLRAEQRRREHQAERQKLDGLDSQLNQMRQEFIDARAAMEQCKAPPAPGETVTNADIARRASMASQYEQYMNTLKLQIMKTMKQREKQQIAVAAALATMRAAEKAIDQLETIDEKLAAEEARLAEIQEELQMEILAKPRWST
jgi:flagellar biosynthesis chaperone FliJ